MSRDHFSAQHEANEARTRRVETFGRHSGSPAPQTVNRKQGSAVVTTNMRREGTVAAGQKLQHCFLLRLRVRLV